MRAYYTAERTKFFSDSDDHILGELTRGHNFALDIEQRAHDYDLNREAKGFITTEITTEQVSLHDEKRLSRPADARASGHGDLRANG